MTQRDNEYETWTEEFGKIRFIAPYANDERDGYIWIETEFDYPSNERRQICDGGDFYGMTLSQTTHGLKEACQNWLRQRRRKQRAGRL